MFKDFTLGQYIPGDSFLHCLDPRSKITFIFLYAIILFLLPDFLSLSAAFAALAAAIYISAIPMPYLLKGLKPLWFLAIFTLLAHMFSGEGDVLFRLGPLKATTEGVLRGILITGRLILLVASTTLLTLTTSPIALTDGVEAMLSPLKPLGVPVYEFALMMTIALRFIPTLIQESDKIMKAQIARGAQFTGGGLIKTSLNVIPLLVPLLISAFRRAEELAIAMEARGYRGGEGRTRYRSLKFKKSDSQIVALGFVSLIMAAVYRFYLFSG